MVVDCLNVAAVSFGKHVWVGLRNKVVVDSMLDEGESNELLFFVLLPLLLMGDVPNPPCLSRRIDHLGSIFGLSLLLCLMS